MLHFHKWKTVKDTGKHIYQQCSKCGKRRIIAVFNGGYQPTDQLWIDTGEFTKPPPLPSAYRTQTPAVQTTPDVQVERIIIKIRRTKRIMNPCAYCNEISLYKNADLPISAQFDGDNHRAYLYNGDGEMVLSSDGKYDYFTIPINNCPMCGRNLQED